MLQADAEGEHLESEDETYLFISPDTSAIALDKHVDWIDYMLSKLFFCLFSAYVRHN